METEKPLDTLVIAKNQKIIMWLILANIICLFLQPLWIVSGLASVVFVYKLAKSLNKKYVFIWAILAFIPLIGLLSLYLLSNKATKHLQSNDIKVGLVGAKAKSLQDFKIRDAA